MPAGLDGNPNPISTPERHAVVGAVARHIEQLAATVATPVLVGIDGRSGAGKSTFADELAVRLHTTAAARQVVVRSTTDSFHQPKAARYRRGRMWPEGYYLDSHDLGGLRRQLLDPMRAGAGHYRTAIFDEPTDTPVDTDPMPVEAGTILLFDGLFLHRPLLREYWHVSVFLDADRRYAADLAAAAGAEFPASPAPVARAAWLARWSWFAQRYAGGWQLYLALCAPAGTATFVIDNNDLARPRITRAPATTA